MVFFTSSTKITLINKKVAVPKIKEISYDFKTYLFRKG